MTEIQIPEELFDRLAKHSVRFETPVDVIEKILAFYEREHDHSTYHEQPKNIIENRLCVPASVEIIFYPKDEEGFKKQFLKSDVAYVLLHYKDGKKVVKVWNRSNFTKESNVTGNLRSGYLRGWRDKGICKAEISVNKEDLV